MHFDLVHGRDDGDFSQQPCQVLGHEVADADRPHPAVRQQLLERPVGHPASGRNGSAAVDAAAAGRGARRRACRRSCRMRAAWPRSGDAGPTDPFSDLALVEVRGRGVDQAIARRNRRFDGGHRVLRRALKHAEANGRHLSAVVQGEERAGGHLFDLHLGITELRDGTAVRWMEKVSDEQYTAGVSSPQQGSARPSGEVQQRVARRIWVSTPAGAGRRRR